MGGKNRRPYGYFKINIKELIIMTLTTNNLTGFSPQGGTLADSPYVGNKWPDPFPTIKDFNISNTHDFGKLNSFDISPHGKILYTVGSGNGHIKAYLLTEPFNLATAVTIGNTMLWKSSAWGTCLQISSDGLSLFIHNNVTRTIQQFSLTTAWDITTAYFYFQFSVTQRTFGISPRGDSMVFYTTRPHSQHPYTRRLSTPWDLKTLSSARGYPVANENVPPPAFQMSPNGKQLFVGTMGNSRLRIVRLSTPFDFETGRHNGQLFLGNVPGNAGTLRWSNDMKKFFIVSGSKLVTLYPVFS